MQLHNTHACNFLSSENFLIFINIPILFSQKTKCKGFFDAPDEFFIHKFVHISEMNFVYEEHMHSFEQGPIFLLAQKVSLSAGFSIYGIMKVLVN